MSDKYRVMVSDKAKNDLKGIYLYITISLFSNIAAKNTVNRIRKKMRELDTFPKRYPIMKYEKMKKEEIRSVCVNDHLIVYKVNEEEKTVNILRIVYGRQDLENAEA